jgi:hypothetical protein
MTFYRLSNILFASQLREKLITKKGDKSYASWWKNWTLARLKGNAFRMRHAPRSLCLFHRPACLLT